MGRGLELLMLGVDGGVRTASRMSVENRMT